MNVEQIHWLGHASFRIDGGKTIYIDPWQMGDAPPADVILVTHDHYDHFSPEDIRKIRRPAATVVSVRDCTEKVPGKTETVKTDDRIVVDDIVIEVVPAYNVNKQFHPKRNGWVGFIIEVDGTRIYHAGDTDLIPEMAEIRADIALFPVGGTYTMDAAEAADAAGIIKPAISIPMHYATIVGSEDDARKFRELCGGEVMILEAE